MMVKMYIIKLTRSTIAYKPLVRPLFNESITVNTERKSKTMDFLPNPKTRGKSINVQTTTTVGILRPIFANAEPNARLMLVWYWLRLAARMAAIPSGSKMTAAIATRTNSPSSMPDMKYILSKKEIRKVVSFLAESKDDQQ